MIVLVSPFMLIAIITIRIVSPEAPAIFKQIRVGRNDKSFVIYKLRTMTNEKDKNGNLLPNEDRIKKWGRAIRLSNIDEFPQILNILKFQMSWIGPRPLLPDEMRVMTEEQRIIRQSVLPGISGWEAINEEKTSTRLEMAEYDLYYVNHWSLWFDIKIFFKTILIVILRLRPDDSLRAPKMPDNSMKLLKKEFMEVGKKQNDNFNTSA